MGRERVLARVSRVLRDDLIPAVGIDRAEVELAAWTAPGEPVSFAYATAQDYAPIRRGQPWGKPWGTTWVRVRGVVPEEWGDDEHARRELSVDLGFLDDRPGFQCEALIWGQDGRPIKGIEPAQRVWWLPEGPGESFTYYIEAAANPDIAQHFSFRETPLGDPLTAGDAELYTWGEIGLVRRHLPTTELIRDLTALTDLVGETPVRGAREERILAAIERALNVVDPEDVRGTAEASRAELSEVLAQPAVPSAHRVHAVGHAHLDSAWLWPLRETRRKVARSFVNVLALMDRSESFTFAATSAQQFAWVEEDYPELFERVRRRVAEGRFIPTGGQWVEPDCNLPSGESLSRQLIEGKRYFLERFGIETEEVWIPDSFGYSGALPQIAASAGARYFLTQKISWNETNGFPHHTFQWEGIDGTRLFTHFPSADTYHAEVSAHDLLKAERQYSEKGDARVSLLPFGWGDGGGGPTEDMLASVERFTDLEGVPTVRHSTPQRFFEEASAEYPDPPVWVGELYLERHRGVATTQIPLKRGNRLAERLLREAEYWSTVATVRRGVAYPSQSLRRLWQEVLLLQFHDILPGSSIAWVHREAREQYVRIHRELEEIIACALISLLGRGDATASVNGSPFSAVGVPGLSAGDPELAPQKRGVDIRAEAGGVVLDAGTLRLTVDEEGEIASLVDVVAERDLVPHGTTAGRIRLFHDTPTTWDAWDVDDHYRARPVDTGRAVSVEPRRDGDDAVVRVRRTFGASSIVIEYRLSPDAPRVDISIDLDWREDQKLLKFVLPVDVHATSARAEIAYGHVERPIHTNTSWDEARFEVVAHRWLHVGEPGYGVALANEATYGYDVTRQVFGGRPAVVIGVSLARAPRYPDPQSDRGNHVFRFALRPGAGIPDAVEEGYRLNVPVRKLTGVETPVCDPLVRVTAPGVMIEAVKLADDGSGDVVVRMYEAHGARARGHLSTSFRVADCTETDLLERPIRRAVRGADEREMRIEMRPFQVMTLRFARYPREGDAVDVVDASGGEGP